MLLVGTTVPLLVAELIFRLRSSRWKRFYQIIFLIPGLVPLVVVFLLWKFLYDPYFGPLSAFMTLFGFERTDFLWLAGPRSALYCLIFIGFPWVSGTSVLIYLAGLNNIPSSVLDACRLEGIGGFQRFRQVDVYFLFGQVKLLLITGFIGLLQMFSLQLIVTRGGPGTATMVPAYHMFECFFLYNRLGYASAIGVVLAAVIFVFSVLNLRFLKTMEL
jgi:ABC-type sugar transport system permease subunit